MALGLGTAAASSRMGCTGSKDDESPLRHSEPSSDTSSRRAEAVVTTPNLHKLHSVAADYLKASRGLSRDFAVQKEEASHQIQALSELNDAARSAWDSKDSSEKPPSCRCFQPRAQSKVAPGPSRGPHGRGQT